MINFLWISLGAVAGAYARYLLSLLINRADTLFPYGTFLINISGSLLLGFLMVLLTERGLADPRWRLLLTVGFCGAYTTFSTYAFETVGLIEQRRWLGAASNILFSNVVGLAAVLAGAFLARAM